MPLNSAAIARKWGFFWGGLYAKPDPMHFEINVTPAQAARLIADLRALDGRPVPPEVIPQPEPDEPAPSTQENDMPIIVTYAKSTFLVNDGKIVHLATQEDIDTLRWGLGATGSLVEWPNVSKDQWRRLVATYGRPLMLTPPDGSFGWMRTRFSARSISAV